MIEYGLGALSGLMLGVIAVIAVIGGIIVVIGGKK